MSRMSTRLLKFGASSMIKKLSLAMFSAALLSSSASYSFAQGAEIKEIQSFKPVKVSDMPTECHITSAGMDCKVY